MNHALVQRCRESLAEKRAAALADTVAAERFLKATPGTQEHREAYAASVAASARFARAIKAHAESLHAYTADAGRK